MVATELGICTNVKSNSLTQGLTLKDNKLDSINKKKSPSPHRSMDKTYLSSKN